MYTDYVCLSLNFSEYRARITHKESLKRNFEKVKRNLISKYEHGSTFHNSLKSAFDIDVQV